MRYTLPDPIPDAEGIWILAADGGEAERSAWARTSVRPGAVVAPAVPVGGGRVAARGGERVEAQGFGQIAGLVNVASPRRAGATQPASPKRSDVVLWAMESSDGRHRDLSDL